ncbi:TolB family protein [Marinirhabdus gelatinilytica]|uniref:WD40 repeat protein n=1 Tax=Marinirhabdus gelatinilytica TaxID=1703343 RepID=A0A370QL01_9FLAO|nr:PD40 domain-containing protein [Marinirhabdus gelatinilytica]RDK89043.1 WD40 repeat protein [Marinirhabdus gelatinilytica]
MKHTLFLFSLLTLLSCKNTGDKKTEETTQAPDTETSEGTSEKIVMEWDNDSLIYPEEKHFKNIRQVTFGGDNAEAYWSYDDTMLVFQSNNSDWRVECDQMFLMYASETFKGRKVPPMISTGKGRTTCAYFLPDNEHFVYGSTHLVDEKCPEVPLRKNGKYVWPVYDSFDIFVSDLQGNITDQLTNEPGYDAEATVSPQGDKIVFTSMRSGDLELYTMNIDGTDVKQITDELGYDGGAFFSPDGTKLIFRASRPKTAAEVKEYKDLLAQGLVQPTEMELFICNADGSDLKQITNLGNANWSPFFTPDGKKVLFSSNFEAERGFPFNLYLIDIDGKNLERVTHSETFDAFPVFSNNGKYLAFSSNRNNGGGRDTNLFIAEWQD